MFTIGLDFDGTCCTHAYPNIGEDIGAIEWLKKLSAMTGVKIVLNTMRDGEELVEAVDWLRDQGVRLYGINNNPDQNRWTTSPKVHADVYVDDLALGVPLVRDQGRPYVDWSVVGPKLVELAIDYA